jgi:sulfopyruvate decarboxylase subunit beta
VTRLECLRAIYDRLSECAVVTIMGGVAAELYSLGHRPNFFYLNHSMGLASSIGLGLAIARPERKVVVLDGDGSLLMNLGTLATGARYAPANLLHVVFDNQQLQAGGGTPTATATGADLPALARAAGIANVSSPATVAAFAAAVADGIDGGQHSFIAAKVETTGGPALSPTDIHMLENRFEFARWLRA